MAGNNSEWLEMAPNTSKSVKPLKKNSNRCQKGGKEFPKKELKVPKNAQKNT